VRRRQRLGAYAFNAPRGDRLGVPVGFREEELQLLHRRRLRLHNRFGSCQRRQGLVPVTWQEQAGEVDAEAFALDPGVEEVVVGLGILLQRHRHSGRCLRRCHALPPFARPLTLPHLQQSTDHTRLR
jgi:hypothetical protein